MTEWIVYRDEDYDAVGLDPAELAGEVYFNLWATKQEPFGLLAEGDTAYLWDRKRKKLVWEVRVRKHLATAYEGIDDALDFLRSAYGLFPEDLNDYIWTKSPNGYLLAWAVEPVAPLDIDVSFLKPGNLGGRAGYLPLEKVPAEQRAMLSLPPSGRPATGEVPDYYAPELAGAYLPATGGRYLPQAVRSEVFRRDGGRCRECGTTEGPLHFDHIYPWSKGGANEVSNLQLLCRTHNLAKGASVTEGSVRPEPSCVLDDLIESVGLDPEKASPAEIVSAFAAGERSGELFGAMLDDDLLDDETLAEMSVAALDAGLVPSDEDAAWLARAVAPVDPVLARSLAEPLLQHPSQELAAVAAFACACDPDRSDDEAESLLERAAAAEEPLVAGPASAALAHLLLEKSGALEEGLDVADQRARVPQRVTDLLLRAANCPDAVARGRAALTLGHLEADPIVASGWYRGALCSPDPDVVAEAAAFLAFDIAPDHPVAAGGLAARALESDDPAVRERGHLVLAVVGAPGAEEHLQQALGSADPEISENAEDLARHLASEAVSRRP